jgi:hypothetical protein
MYGDVYFDAAVFTGLDLGLGFTLFHTRPSTAAIVCWLKAAIIKQRHIGIFTLLNKVLQAVARRI